MRKWWDIRNLEEITEVFEDGDWIESKDQSTKGVRLIQTGNVGNGIFKDRGEKARHISTDTFKRLRCTEIFSGDCLVSRLPDPVGRACILPEVVERMITAVDCTIIRFKNSVVLPKWFVFYTLSREYAIQIDKQITGATRQRISRKNLGLIEIPIPPLSEQKDIVAILDEAFAAIAKAKDNAKKNLQNARELFESYLQNVFNSPCKDWDEKKLSEAFEIKPSKNEAKQKLKETDLVSFLPMEDLDVLSNEIKAVKERKLKEVVGSYTYFADNDVLLAKITPCFENGKIGIARNLKNGIGFGSSEYIVFRSKGDIIPEYLYFFLSRNQFRAEGKERMTGAVGHKRVSKEFVEEYMLPFPKSSKEQKLIVNKFNVLNAETKKLETIYQQKLNDLEELKKSILQKAFNGELTAKAKTLIA